MSDDSRPLLPDEPGSGDYLHAITKGSLSAVPIIGGVVSELFTLVLAPTLSERRDIWLQQLAEDLDALKRKVDGFTIESLGNKPEFVSAVLKASQSALMTHQNEKHDALRNAVMNVAAGTAPNDDLQSIFLSLIDLLTPYHLRLLKQFSLQRSVRVSDAPSWLKADACSQVAKDLLDRGLIGTPSHLVPSRDELIVGRDGLYTFNVGPTQLGKQFLSFIRSPPQLD
jgi:hypothetical protein